MEGGLSDLHDAGGGIDVFDVDAEGAVESERDKDEVFRVSDVETEGALVEGDGLEFAEDAGGEGDAGGREAEDVSEEDAKGGAADDKLMADLSCTATGGAFALLGCEERGRCVDEALGIGETNSPDLELVGGQGGQIGGGCPVWRHRAKTKGDAKELLGWLRRAHPTARITEASGVAALDRPQR
jgi:hypothetical protein